MFNNKLYIIRPVASNDAICCNLDIYLGKLEVIWVNKD